VIRRKGGCPQRPQGKHPHPDGERPEKQDVAKWRRRHLPQEQRAKKDSQVKKEDEQWSPINIENDVDGKKTIVALRFGTLYGRSSYHEKRKHGRR